MEHTPQQPSEFDAQRGIRNTTARFAEVAQNRLLASVLQNKLQKGDAKQSEDENDNTFNIQRAQMLQRQTQQLLSIDSRRQSIIDDFIAKERLEKDTFDIEMVKNPPAEKTFPYLIVLIAALKDILDPIATLTLFGILLTIGIMLPISLVLFFWIRGKMTGGWWKKKAIRYLWKRYVLAIIIESIPFVQIVPVTTIFVLMAHNREKKFVRLFNSLLETLHAHRIPLR